ncbi:MAG: site-specific DNA-methyltransferase, partial [Bacteroidales bacterium]|nr:site-specific DNA-methyltransferase [Bacteroidales bacterium]
MDKEQKITNNIKVPNKDMEVLKKHFSHCFNKNGNFDIEKFKQELSENEIDFYKESYGMDWLGKSYARLLASDSATTLLKEDEIFNQKEENKNSENLLIKGDNLEVLKHLSNAYYEKIKMIYIDPPYNTGSDGFVYEDDRKFTINEFRNLAGVDEDKAKRILSFVDSKSNSHSAWLTFMYPRLYIAKQLLKDDGVIFISIDDNEVAQLRLLMDEVFGEENFVGQLARRVKSSGKTTDKIASNHDYLLIYEKTNSDFNQGEHDFKGYDLKDEYFEERGYYKLNQTLDYDSLSYGKSLDYPIEKDGVVFYPGGNKELWEERQKGNHNRADWAWRWCEKLFEFGYDNGFIVIKDGNGRKRIYTKTYQKVKINNKILEIETFERGKSLTSIEFVNKEYSNDNATKEIKFFFEKSHFDYAKPTSLIKKLIAINTCKNATIIDFFAGSGTTGDATMQLNVEDGGKRKCILVQLPEKINPKNNKSAYDFVKNELGVAEPTIFEITKERLIRASKKIKEETIKTKIAEKQKEIKGFEGKLDLENKEEKIQQHKAEIKALKNQDLGFKIFETMPIWEDYNFEADELDAQTKLFDESKLTENDLKALLVTWKTYDGISLTESLQEIDLGKYSGYYTSDKLYLTNKGFKTENLKILLEKIDSDKKFNPTSIIAFGYHFESKNLREIAENIKSYANKKNIDIDFIT